MDIQEWVKKKIEYYETQEKVWTREVIDDLNELRLMTKEDNTDEKPYQDYLKSK